MSVSVEQRIAEELGVREGQVKATVELLDGGSTVPFIARYRKEVTGMLDDAQLRTLEERLRYLRELDERRLRRARFDPQPGQAGRGPRGLDPRRGHEVAARGHLPPVQAEAPHEGDDRARGGPRAAGRRPAERPHHGPARRGRGVRRRGQGRRGRAGRPRRRPLDPRRALRRGRRPHRRPAREDVGPGPPRGQGPRRQGGGRRQVLRLLRLLRALHQAPLAPDPRDAARREGGGPRPHDAAGRADRRAAGRADRLRDAHRREVRRHQRGPPRRQVAERHRALGVAHQDPAAPGHRPADAAAPGGRGRRRARVRVQPARPAARRPGLHPRHDGPRPGLPHRRQGGRRGRDRQGRRHPRHLPAPALPTSGTSRSPSWPRCARATRSTWSRSATARRRARRTSSPRS